MNNEHDDDLEAEVIEGAEVETEAYGDAQNPDEAEPVPMRDQSSDFRPATEIDDEESEDEASDTI